VFLRPGHYYAYLNALAEETARAETAVWAYCLMPNHVHLLLVPKRPDSLAATIRRTHGDHAQRLNAERGWSGHLWAGRYYSAPMDEVHTWAAVRYVELNPVRAGLVAEAADYPWSSAPAHARGAGDPRLAPDRPFPGTIPDWSAWLRLGLADEEIAVLRERTARGLPIGSETFVAAWEQSAGRSLRPRPRGRPVRKGVCPL
jgi:putative transposase